METCKMNKSRNLPAWHELIGVFKGISIDMHFTHIEIDNTVLAFHNSSEAAKKARKKLCKRLVGWKIAILRTDHPDKPILIRLLSSKPQK